MHQKKSASKDVGWTSGKINVGQVTEALKATRVGDAWKVLIAYTKEQGT